MIAFDLLILRDWSDQFGVIPAETSRAPTSPAQGECPARAR
jgi:hypothetical protein